MQKTFLRICIPTRHKKPSLRAWTRNRQKTSQVLWEKFHGRDYFCLLGLWIAWTSKLTLESIEEVCICFWKTGLLQNQWKNQSDYSRDYIRVAFHTKPERSLSQRDPWLDKIIFRCHTSKIQFLNQDMFSTVQMKTRVLLSTARSLLSFGFRLSCLSIAPRHSTEDGHLIIWCCGHTDQEWGWKLMGN